MGSKRSKYKKIYSCMKGKVMNMGKSRKIILSIIIALICGTILTVMLIKNNNKGYENNYIYKINYFEEYIPGCNHDIYFLDNNQIKVVSQRGNSSVEYVQGKKKMPKEEENINFSEKNMQILWEWANQITDGVENTSVTLEFKDLYDIDDYDNRIINSLIRNDESYLEVSNLNESSNNTTSIDSET